MTAGAVTSGASDVPGRPSHYRFPRQATAKSIHYGIMKPLREAAALIGWAAAASGGRLCNRKVVW